jgi:hypothetical protein
MVVDYRKVNNIMEKDHYTMANAEMELDKLKGKKVFTKFDIRAGYNNILIEKGDQFKAGFKMQIRTYIPQVLLFGLFFFFFFLSPLDFAMPCHYSNEPPTETLDQSRRNTQMNLHILWMICALEPGIYLKNL